MYNRFKSYKINFPLRLLRDQTLWKKRIINLKICTKIWKMFRITSLSCPKT